VDEEGAWFEAQTGIEFIKADYRLLVAAWMSALFTDPRRKETPGA
jgi:hypothetical protein